MPSGSDQRTLDKIQAWSGMVFSSYVTLHVGNHLLALVSQRAYDAAMSALREVYRPMEMVGLLSLAAHMACGAVRVWRRYDTVNRLVPLSARSTSDLHRLGGHALLVMLPLHVWHMRVQPAASGSDADFAYVTYLLHNRPYFWWPFLVSLFVIGGYHTGHGWLTSLAFLGVISNSTAEKWQRRHAVLMPTGIMAAVVIMAGFHGVFYKVNTFRFPEYSKFGVLHQ